MDVDLHMDLELEQLRKNFIYFFENMYGVKVDLNDQMVIDSYFIHAYSIGVKMGVERAIEEKE